MGTVGEGTGAEMGGRGVGRGGEVGGVDAGGRGRGRGALVRVWTHGTRAGANSVVT